MFFEPPLHAIASNFVKVEEESIHATISQTPNEDSLITFTDPPHLDQRGESKYLEKITQRIGNVVTLNSQLQALNKKFGLEREYIAHLNKQKSFPTPGLSSRLGDVAPFGGYGDVMDEDLEDEVIFS